MYDWLVVEENLAVISDMDGVGLLIAAVQKHSSNAKVVKNACLALASLVEVDGRCRSTVGVLVCDSVCLMLLACSLIQCSHIKKMFC